MVEHAPITDLDGARSTYENVVQTGRRTGDGNVAGAILGLACLDGELADWHRAAMLSGSTSCCSTRRELRGNPSTRAVAGKASTKHAKPSAMSSSSRPTPAA